MLKKVFAGILILAVSATAAACSSNNKDSSATVSPTAAATATPAASAAPQDDVYKVKAYIAARLAEERVNYLFNEDKAGDKPVLNHLVPKDKAQAYLNNYFDPTMTDKLMKYYLTGEQANGNEVVNAKPFLESSILKTKKEEVTYEGTPDEVKIKLKDGTVYTVKKAGDKYVVSNYGK